MALFGEKYGDVVRMVEVGDGNWSRELCGGTHVRSTAVIGAFKITTETSSAANVRRIEAITSPAALEELRSNDRVLTEAAHVLRTSPDQVADVAADRERKRRELEKQSRRPRRPTTRSRSPSSSTASSACSRSSRSPTRRRCPTSPTASRTSSATPRSSSSACPARVASTCWWRRRRARSSAASRPARWSRPRPAVGGGGGGRDNMAQAGGKDPEKLPDALAAARAEIERALAGPGA